ncbi:MAG TPA: riboflavin synthase, partial [Hyphomicrobium sp.]|nr:riboflavin synthase [Hyphomicrobium sp.]
MFTGLITDVGEVVARNGGQFTIATAYRLTETDTGASICCDGVCLTATSILSEAAGARFMVDVSNETLSKTSLAAW